MTILKSFSSRSLCNASWERAQAAFKTGLTRSIEQGTIANYRCTPEFRQILGATTFDPSTGCKNGSMHIIKPQPLPRTRCIQFCSSWTQPKSLGSFPKVDGETTSGRHHPVEHTTSKAFALTTDRITTRLEDHTSTKHTFLPLRIRQHSWPQVGHPSGINVDLSREQWGLSVED